MRKLVLLLVAVCSLVSTVFAQKTPLISEFTGSMKKYDGFVPFYWDEANGKIYLEVGRFDQEFLYVNSLKAGLGSNDIGLDRNQLGKTRVVRFYRIGPKVLLIQSNYSFRAESDNGDEVKAVKDAFAESTIWGFTVSAEESGKVLLDMTGFLLRDAHGVAARLKIMKQGNFRQDPSRSAIYLPATKNFPLNSEFEAMVTFTGTDAGRYLRQVAADDGSFTLRLHHSFIKLPDDGYEPRAYDPRSGYFGFTYKDYAAPINRPVVKRLINRHRLQKKNPSAKVSAPVKPIVYYIDRGAPEPILSALMDGAKWWNQAFEAIGYRNAFQVKLLPEGADPMDIRYNVVNWVHRATRGWSYGDIIADPRTGEIIKGNISLGSLRVRQDFMIAEGLVADYKNGNEDAGKMLDMALARIRQLSCHEIGHTLGLCHNYASSVNDRASVMDYPHPLVKIAEDGTISLDDAYATGIGQWDIVTIAYGYQDFPGGTDENTALKKILDDAFQKGLYFLTDQDARGEGSAHPLAHLWDNGKNPVDELKRVMRVRKTALETFSENRIRKGMPFSTLEDVLVPVYLFHRYQIEATSKVIGGVYYHHALKGYDTSIQEPASGQEQRTALDALLSVLLPENLTLRKDLISKITPNAPGYESAGERFSGYTGITFDPFAAAENIATVTVRLLLNPQRAARMIDQHALDNSLPGFYELLDKLLDKTVEAEMSSGYDGELQRVVNYVVLDRLFGLGADAEASPQTKALVQFVLKNTLFWLNENTKETNDINSAAHYRYCAGLIERYFNDPDEFIIPRLLNVPPGSPIGMR